MNTAEKMAWNVNVMTLPIMNATMALIWLLAYIKKPVMQLIYYRAITWMIPIGWTMLFAQLICLIIGGAMNSGHSFGVDIGLALMEILFSGLYDGLAYFYAPKNVEYYRWDEQDWWNYEPDEAPENWPSQLGDFD